MWARRWDAHSAWSTNSLKSSSTPTTVFNLDIPARNGTPNEWALPVSATYVIDSDGSIVYAYMDVDYRDRADPRDVLAVLMRKAVAA